ncbi:MAG: manganese-binding transcriptional regulator MntR [Planctomycetota bacterium]
MEMATVNSTKAAHRRTRADHATETAEDYVEAIDVILRRDGVCRVSDLAKRFGVSHVTVNRTLARLDREGLVMVEPYQPVDLTAKGRRLAVKCAERHRIVFEFLLALGVDEHTAAVDAEGIEHHVSERTLQRFASATAEMNDR